MLYKEPADQQVGPSVVTVADAAKILGRKPAEVRQLIAAGELISEKRGDGRRVVDLESVTAYRGEMA